MVCIWCSFYPMNKVVVFAKLLFASALNDEDFVCFLFMVNSIRFHWLNFNLFLA